MNCFNTLACILYYWMNVCDVLVKCTYSWKETLLTPSLDSKLQTAWETEVPKNSQAPDDPFHVCHLVACYSTGLACVKQSSGDLTETFKMIDHHRAYATKDYLLKIRMDVKTIPSSLTGSECQAQSTLLCLKIKLGQKDDSRFSCNEVFKNTEEVDDKLFAHFCLICQNMLNSNG